MLLAGRLNFQIRLQFATFCNIDHSIIDLSHLDPQQLIMRLSFMALMGSFLPTIVAATAASAAAAAAAQEVLITDMINWLRANGAFINDKLQIRHINPDDPSSPRGLFALESLEEGETVCNIPWELIISPSEKAVPPSERYMQLDCGTINAVYEEISKSESDMTPYGKYLLSQPRGYTLGFWSKEGQDLFWEMTNDEKLPPVWVEDIIDDWEEECGGDAENDIHLFAMMLVKARADYQYLVPFYGEFKHTLVFDVRFCLLSPAFLFLPLHVMFVHPFSKDMMNHHNGKKNVVHKHHSYMDPIDKTGYEIVTSKPVLAGDELFYSYNHCVVCDQYLDWFGTPEMFLHFGFVEGYPQRWLFDFARVKFDLDWKDGDEETGKR